MSYENRRKLSQKAFAGKDAEGKRLGVYVKNTNGKWTFTINGILNADVNYALWVNLKEGSLPMEKWEMVDILGSDLVYVEKN